MLTIRPRAGDYGTVIQFRMLTQDGEVLNCSTATEKKVYMRKPDGQTQDYDAEFVTDGSDGKLKITILTTHWATVGTYLLEPVVTFANAKWGGYPNLRIRVASSLRT